MTANGWFGLETADDLFLKLESDYARVIDEPFNAFRAYDFVVTAWHLLEWWERGAKQRRAIRDVSPLLQLCEHLAVGAKHFAATGAQHQSVKGTDVEGPWAAGVWAKGSWAPGFWDERVVVYLEPAAAAALGT